MNRHPALRPWSREHHGALSLARSLREAQGPEARSIALARLDVLRAVLLAHLDAEEGVLPALLERLGGRELAERLLAEHAELRAGLTAPEGEDLPALGELLEAHVRFEERELYPWLEAHAGEAALAALGH